MPGAINESQESLITNGPELADQVQRIIQNGPELADQVQRMIRSRVHPSSSVFTLENEGQPSSNFDDINQQSYDAWVLAGGRLFRAHAHILSAHSPYLRASLTTVSEGRLLLPHIPAGGFSAVLTYMYTGRLSLAYAPIYEILITGHLLQMTEVVRLCETLLTAPMFHPPPPTITSRLPYVSANEVITSGHEEGTLPPALNAWRNLARFVPTAEVISPIVHPTLVKPTPKKATPTIDKKSPTLENRERSSSFLRMEQYIYCSSIKKKAQQNNISCSSSPSTSSYKDHDEDDEDDEHIIKSSSLSPSSSAVILDIAACDGPVFFERVINKTFRGGGIDAEEDSETDESEINVVDTSNSEPRHNHDNVPNDVTTSKSESSSPTPAPNTTNSRTYHCVYCNNTFKSHYCYQKHARRHINPITTEEDSAGIDKTQRKTSSPNTEEQSLSPMCNSPDEEQKSIEIHPATTSIIFPPKDLTCQQQPKTGVTQNMVSNPSTSAIGTDIGSSKIRVLDLNVQYFPCKTCGSKFPSYYFVHKHRRMCHNEEEDSNPPQQEKKDNCSSNDSFSNGASSIKSNTKRYEKAVA